jgi:NHLM bacteriocin system ABC transporter ATP-binding protein
VTDTLERGAAGARLVQVGGDRPFLLHGTTTWRVLAGRVDVFAVRVRGGVPAGGRTHLFRAGPGELLCGGPAVQDGIAMLAVGATGTELAEVDRAGLVPAGLPSALEAWVAHLCDAAWSGVLPDDCKEIASGEARPAPGALHLRPLAPVAWVRHEAGASLLCGLDGVRVNGVGYTPLSRGAWLLAEEGSVLRVDDTAHVLGSREAWAGVDRLYGLLLDCLGRRLESATAAERDRLDRKTAAGRRALQGACAELAGSVSGERLALAAPGAAAGGGDDALFAACRLVAEARGVTVRRPAGEDATRGDPLSAIARASRLRTRVVVLRSGWHLEDGGPILARLSADKRPVALLVGREGYVLRDPATGEERRVTQAVTEELEAQAHTFYRSFPDAALTMGDVLRFGLKGCGPDLWMVALTATAGALLSLLVPVATGMIFNDVIPGAARGQLLQLTVVLVAIAVATGMFAIATSVALIRVDTRMGSAVQAAVWDRVLGLPMPFFRPYSAGELATRAGGIDAIRQVLSGATVTAMLGGVFSLVHFGLLFHYSTTLAWWSVLIIGLAVACTALGSWIQVGPQRSAAGMQSRLAGSVLQFLSSIGKLRVAGAEGHAFAIWAQGFGRQRQFQYRARRVGNLLAAMNAAYPLAAAVALYALAHPLFPPDGTLRTGDFLAFMSSFTICLGGLLGASSALLATLQVVPLYEQCLPVLQTRPEVDLGKADPGTLRGEIELQHVTFRYQADGPPVLRDVSLRIRAGEFVAFVGPSGSGKSTILRLLLGFETPESGALYYDGQELAGLDVQAVRRQIGVVLQNGRLSSGDIYSNIVGSSTATIEMAWEAARLAGFEQDVKAMPMGMHTVISEGGGTLSGGQRQRLMIARAIVRRPRILYFDEATSALDNRTQAIVSASLERLQATRVVVAHRLSTIANADRIVVVDAGRIVQTGSYEELMAQEGPFRELALRQLT